MNLENRHNPYSPPRAHVQDPVDGAERRVKTPWGRAAQFYWAFLWRALLIFCGMALLFLAVYGFVQWALDSWPLVERGVRLICILTLLTCASCFGIQWAAKSRFHGYQLRPIASNRAADSTASPPSDELTFGRAARLFGSHLWRCVLGVVPVNVLLELVVARQTELASGWPRILEAQATNVIAGLLVGAWAMREALSLTYRSFRLTWVPGSSAPAPNAAASPPATAANP